MSPTGPQGHGPDGRFKKYAQDEHAGNDIVNDGSPRRADAAADGASDPDELELRRLMRQAVADIAPSDEALEHLRRAVPARRARKRQAVVGVVAAGVFVAMAVPAVLHVANTGSAGDRPSIAGHSETTHGGVGVNPSSSGGQDSVGSPSTSQDGKDENGKDKDGKGGATGSDGTAGSGAGGTAGPTPGSTAAASSPACDATDLNKAVADVGTPDASGTVYGSFRVSNVSDANCTIDSPGSMVTLAQGAADPTKVSVVDHTSGDKATGLPDPSTEPSQLILEPGSAYEVRFAWVPSGQCPSTGTGTGGTGVGESPSPTPTSGDTGNGADTGTQTGTSDSGLSTQLGSEDTADGSVVVSHTAEPGEPSVSATIPDACAGTVYRTGALPAS
ncbi:hypothetical protein AB0J38_06785 [Streptomyces sp. NPDC050095]|uniref:hypothetical protein n=1 Tax=unclassified Streptomyces TaxID=2593676 RepID=UPI0034440C0B